MLLKNIGTKIINVGAVVLMPGEETKISEKAAKTPSIKALCKRGLLSLEEEAKPAKKEEPAKKAEKTAEEPVEEVIEEKAENEEAEEAAPAKKTAKRASRSKKASE